MPDDLKPTDDTTGTETSVEDITKADTYAAFEKLRRQAEAGSTAVPPVKRDDTDAPPDETGEESTKDSDDGSADAGSQKAAKKTDQLPSWVKKRLEREKRRVEVARKEAAEWRNRFEESQSAAPRSEEEKPEEEVKEPTTETTASDEPLPQDEYDEKYEYPDEADYGTDTTDGLSAFLDDVDRWERNLPLQGGKHAEGKTTETEDAGARAEPQATVDPEPSETAPIDNDVPDPDQIIQQQFEDLREALEEAEGSEDDLAQDFFDQLQADKFKLSAEMLEWLADHDDAAKVAAQFVKAPRKANRIFRAPKSKHAQLLAELAVDDAEQDEPQTTAKDNRAGKPVVRDINARRPRDPNKRLVTADNFSAYEQERNRIAQGAN